MSFFSMIWSWLRGLYESIMHYFFENIERRSIIC